jgi:hypothetical protein
VIRLVVFIVLRIFGIEFWIFPNILEDDVTKFKIKLKILFNNNDFFEFLYLKDSLWGSF